MKDKKRALITNKCSDRNSIIEFRFGINQLFTLEMLGSVFVWLKVSEDCECFEILCLPIESFDTHSEIHLTCKIWYIFVLNSEKMTYNVSKNSQFSLKMELNENATHFSIYLVYICGWFSI